MKAIIPTGGRGTRMYPLTFSTNKHFIPIGNKPLIYYPIESVVNAGIKEILITYNLGKFEEVNSFLGDGSKWGMKFTYVLQEKPQGLANIFEVCEKEIAGDNFLLHLGDNIFTEGINDLVKYFLKEKPIGMVAKIKHSENWRLGVPIFDKKGKLTDYIEKPAKPPNEYAVPGIYFFNSIIFNCFKGRDAIKPSARGEYEILEPYKWLIKKGYQVDVVDYKGTWLDPGKFDDWIKDNQFLLDKNVKNDIKGILDNTKVEGRIEIKKGSKISNSEIRGPVSIGSNVTIENCYVGPFTSIDDNCCLSKCHIENSVLMKGVMIKDIRQPIDESLIGTETDIIDEDGPVDHLKLFVGEKSKIKF